MITSTRGEPEVDGIRVHRLDVPLLPFYKVIYRRPSVDRAGDVLRRRPLRRGALPHRVLADGGGGAVPRRTSTRIPSVLTEHSVLKGAGGGLLAR